MSRVTKAVRASKVDEAVVHAGQALLTQTNNGLPSLDLSEMQGVTVPMDYEIIGVLGDILMCEIADESDKGEVLRSGIWVKPEVTQKMWRVAKVIMAGPQVSKNVSVGSYVMYPSDKGIPAITHNKKKMVFLNEPRIFCVVKPT